MTEIFVPYASQPHERPTRRIVVDPITRIEGHLRIEADVRAGRVADAWSSGTMLRGIELVLQGRDPRDAWLFAQRICGVCTTVHALASVSAVEAALGIDVPDNARLVRHLITGAQFAQDHVVHFYHLHSPDWVDLSSALAAEPSATSTLARSISEWPNSSPEYFAGVRSRLQAFVDSGQTGIFGTAYSGHPAHELAPEANLLFMAHYLEALAWQREMVKIHAILGGKNPHPQTYLVGGMAVPVDPDSSEAINADRIADMRQVIERALEFVRQVYLPDLLLLASSYPSWSALGGGVGRYLTLGGFADKGESGNGGRWLPSGVLREPKLDAAPEAISLSAIGEHVARSWYSYEPGAASRHPREGETNLQYTGPEPPYDRLDTEAEYSWLKAPRYDDEPMEVGPLARMAVAYAAGHESARAAIDEALAALGWETPALFSTSGRMLARGVETLLVAGQMSVWLDELEQNMVGGDVQIHNGDLWDPSTWPREAEGQSAVAAPRGVLTHWLRIENGSIAHYQVIAPTTWNGSPRDANGVRGPWESALRGTPVADAERPIELLRTVHSFDPCMACAVHVVDGRRRAQSSTRAMDGY